LGFSCGCRHVQQLVGTADQVVAGVHPHRCRQHRERVQKERKSGRGGIAGTNGACFQHHRTNLSLLVCRLRPSLFPNRRPTVISPDEREQSEEAQRVFFSSSLSFSCAVCNTFSCVVSFSFSLLGDDETKWARQCRAPAAPASCGSQARSSPAKRSCSRGLPTARRPRSKERGPSSRCGFSRRNAARSLCRFPVILVVGAD